MKSNEMEFWDSRYRAGKMPWDFGGIPAALAAYLKTTTPRRALIPGCGSGYEVRAFHEHGWDVLATDYSPAAIERARQVLGALADKVVLADFFAHDFGRQKFDVIYERTFLCSLPPEIWPQYAQRMAELLADGGELIGLFFYGQEDEPPPYPLTEKEAQELFSKHSPHIVDEPVSDSLPLFAGRERWQVWRRKQAAQKGKTP
ncbi:MAG TPA: SAM-dependent methyltransferase [Verrucomicrobia subdivision 3 bacterium]|nr:SAM-dependent methyltransferase [Limisphaerales bacterium]